MLIKKKMSPTKKLLMIAVFVLCVSVIAFLLFDTFVDVKPKSREAANNLDGQSLQVQSVSLTDDFISKQPYVQLRNYGTAEMPATYGRRNPFRAVSYQVIEDTPTTTPDSLPEDFEFEEEQQ